MAINRNSPCPCGSGKKYKHCCINCAPPAGVESSASYVLQTALEHHQAGRLPQAEALYKRLLEIDPNHPDALHFLGVICLQVGKTSLAVDLMTRAVCVDPSNPVYHSNLGNALEEQGKIEEAVARYCKALSLKPDFTDAHYNLGCVLEKQSKFDAAAASYRSAIRFKPHYAEAHNNLGSVLRNQGKLSEAVASYVEALSLKPSYAEAHNNLGNALLLQGNVDEAVFSYRQALSLKPNFVEAHNNLGNGLRKQGKLGEAVASFRRALSLKSDYAEAHNNLGSALEEQGKIEEAVASFNQALLLKPDYAAAFSNLIYLHAFSYDISPEALCTFAAGWETIVLTEAERAAAHGRKFACPPRVGRRLNLGVVSAEIGQHAVAEFLQPFLEHLDHSRFSLTLYPTVSRPEPRATRIKELADNVRELVGISDIKAADLIRSDRIDILLDTSGHTSDCRLGIFARRAAPVQCFSIGFWATTGLTEMDWHISEKYLPSTCDTHFREGLWRLPRLAVAYNGDSTLPESHWKPSSDGTIWLGSFNRYSKIREQSLSLWVKVLKAIPESRLLLEDRAVYDQDSHERIRAGLSCYGIDNERVEFYPYVPGHMRHMVLYDRLDIALDTIPFNSGTTACDALWMGVPLVALEGTWLGGRIASTFLRALGRTEWIAQDEDEYVAIVARLARDVEGRKSLRSSQRAAVAASPLCDAKGLAEALEDAFEAMFDQWWAKQ